MSKINRLIIFLPLFMLGCAPNVIEENKVIQKIESLDMTIFSNSGDKIYSITSPNSSYDNIELEFELKKPIINILNGEEIKYIISSEESTLSDNNKLLKLKGNVKLKTLKNNEDILNADNFIWNIENTNYLLLGIKGGEINLTHKLKILDKLQLLSQNYLDQHTVRHRLL